ncbi:hypothetical protein NCER_101814 [Vairimorpha ceranae BRL01]|uniref:Uncharacterized protein n=2 Tax=Vairimorpha ceranae TaxID=40302 RepID=C4VAT8_VAIC1|nr:hypothetical protein AAJ76_1100005667 [Vairimorpha ceranae]EEQ81665.1 hypothetical protein NCER_101814 [Vairimorpha ceranae BRL01]KAF5139866.1 hypothetical protein G9O61_00g020360 [Vairimorpha ceranae]KKO74150.1 hypothetical protein AAJ76_1100005667 [Vairimorpha ceranae]
MDFYYKTVQNFINTFSNNLFNEYNKNLILKDKCEKYKSLYNNNLLKKALIKIDKKILNFINLLYKKSIERKYNTITHASNDINKYFTKSNKQNTNIINYKSTFFNKIKNTYYRFKNWFLSEDKYFVKNILIKNINNPLCYTEEGLSDYKLITDITNIVKINKVENLNKSNWTFEITTYNPINNIVSNKQCIIKNLKDNDVLKIDSITCENL